MPRVVMVGSDDETDFHSQLEYQYRNLYAGFHKRGVSTGTLQTSQ